MLESLGSLHAQVLLLVQFSLLLLSGPSPCVPHVLAGNISIIVESEGQVHDAGGAQVLETILLQEVVLLLPDGSSLRVGIGLGQVHGVGVDVEGDHVLFVEVNDCECRIVRSIGGSRAGNKVKSDWLFGLHAHGEEDLLVVGVTEHREPDDVLVSVHESMEPHPKLVEATNGRNVTNEISKSSIFLELAELVLQPLDLLSGVLSIRKKPPV
mmetsp:Transcript_12878/g.21783  ORF Transcript_12878/g.21783 Transcript_12878/m.21783 type:complete len:211 (-) Transcript_12878:1242-1874(-)